MTFFCTDIRSYILVSIENLDDELCDNDHDFGLTSVASAYDLLDGANNLDSMKPYGTHIENYSIEIEGAENNESAVLDDLTNSGDGFFEKGQYVDALETYSVVVSQAKSTTLKDKSNLLRAICGSLLSYGCLNEEQLAVNSFNKLVEMTNLFNDDLDNIGWIKNSPVYAHYDYSTASAPCFYDYPRLDSMNIRG